MDAAKDTPFPVTGTPRFSDAKGIVIYIGK